MESTNYKIVRKFISNDEVNSIIDWVNSINLSPKVSNKHITILASELNGTSNIFDISNTKLTNYITNFQSATKVSQDELPIVIKTIIKRISTTIGIPTDNIFLQAVDMNKGGKINHHYDAAIEGYINYKCNISVLADDYQFFIDKDILDIEQTDMYCFEASLYRHWTNEFNSRRILLSFGFVLPYATLGRDDSDPRVRLSKRIEKYFQR